MIEVKLNGFNRVRNSLRNSAREMPRTTGRVVGEHVRTLRTIAKSTPYPARRPKQTYRRTGRLANSFRAVRGDRLGEWSIQNSALYAQHVIDKEQQAWMHKGRWWTIQDIERRYRPQLTRNLTNAVMQGFEE